MKHWARIIGWQPRATTVEKLVSSLGAGLGILLIFYISYRITDYQGALAILPSMGAAAVLLFAVPHGPLSQPWALFAGNLLGAASGVTAALLISNPFIASAMAVGLSVLMMHLARCLHPPGGATALAAVVGGEAIQQLGYWYVLVPTLLNCLVIFAVAMLFNNCFAWRRYPLALMHYERAGAVNNPDTRRIREHHISRAISEMDLVLDADVAQLKRVIDKADELMRKEKVADFDLEAGAFYTNGQAGMRWSVRQVIDTHPHDDPARYSIIYRTVAGINKGHTGSASLEDFAAWAKEKMQPTRKVG
ncbi:MAG TPA: HPP family protein [Pseudomonadales bacterium]